MQIGEGFGQVNTRLNSLMDAILNKVPKATTLWKGGDISTRKQIRNVQIPLHMIETNSEGVNALLQQFQDLSLDINELWTQKLVQFQRVAIQELVDREQVIGDHLLRLKGKEVEARKDIEDLKKEKYRLMVEKVQLWVIRVCLEQAVSVA